MTRKFRKIGFKQSLIMDVALASILVQVAPGLLNRYLFSNNPLTGMTSTAAGVGTAYVLGAFMNKPDMVNAALALGAVELVTPLIGEITGVGTPISKLPGTNMVPGVSPAQAVKYAEIAEYISLNDALGAYVGSPNVMSRQQYDDSY